MKPSTDPKSNTKPTGKITYENKTLYIDYLFDLLNQSKLLQNILDDKFFLNIKT
jgi:hypothetical protein